MSESSNESALADALVARNRNRRAIDEAMGRITTPTREPAESRKRHARDAEVPPTSKAARGDATLPQRQAHVSLGRLDEEAAIAVRPLDSFRPAIGNPLPSVV